MAMRTVYGTQASGAQVGGGTLDAIFLDIFQLGGITQCAATGTNAITLTPTANQAVVTTPLPLNGQRFDFVAAANSSGSVTVQVGAGSFVPLFRADGTTQVGSGGVVGSTPYQVMFLSALNTGAGGMVLVSAGATGVTAGSYTNPSLTIDASGRVTTAANGVATLSSIVNSLSGDVALNNVANFFDGPSVAQGATGTWFASGTVTLIDTAGSAQFQVKLWDGTTVISSASVISPSVGVVVPVSLSGFLAAPAGNLRMSVKDISSTSGAIKFNASGSSKDSTVSAFRIA